MGRLSLSLAAALAACGDVVAPPGDAGVSSDGAAFELPPPDAPLAWIVVSDSTSGVLVGPQAGADIDAVSWDCGDGRTGFGRQVVDGRRDGEGSSAVARAVGAPDGPCAPAGHCAVTLGRGWIAVKTERSSLSGCGITVYEVADMPDEAYEVWACPAPEIFGCRGPLALGSDGQPVTATVP